MLRGKSALVTGGTHGIGLGVVERFLREGARVATLAREDPAELPAEVVFLRFDLADHAAIPGLVAAAE